MTGVVDERERRSARRGGLDPRRLGRLVARTRVVAYVVLVALVGYYFWRYDFARIPEGAISPLDGVPAGVQLVIDAHPGALEVGDAVLYRTADGARLLGRIDTVPPSAPDEMHARCAAGALWIVKDRPDAAGPDSTSLGPIERSDVEGRIQLALPW